MGINGVNGANQTQNIQNTQKNQNTQQTTNNSNEVVYSGFQTANGRCCVTNDSGFSQKACGYVENRTTTVKTSADSGNKFDLGSAIKSAFEGLADLLDATGDLLNSLPKAESLSNPYASQTDKLTAVNDAIQTWGDSTLDVEQFAANRTEANWNNLETTGNDAITASNTLDSNIKASEDEIAQKCGDMADAEATATDNANKADAAQVETENKSEEAQNTADEAKTGAEGAKEKADAAKTKFGDERDTQLSKMNERVSNIEREVGKHEETTSNAKTAWKDAQTKYDQALGAKTGLENALKQAEDPADRANIQQQLDEIENLKTEAEKLEKTYLKEQEALDELKQGLEEAQNETKDYESSSLKQLQGLESEADNAKNNMEVAQKNADDAAKLAKTAASNAATTAESAHEKAETAIKNNANIKEQAKSMKEYNNSSKEVSAQLKNRGNRALTLHGSTKPADKGADTIENKDAAENGESTIQGYGFMEKGGVEESAGTNAASKNAGAVLNGKGGNGSGDGVGSAGGNGGGGVKFTTAQDDYASGKISQKQAIETSNNSAQELINDIKSRGGNLSREDVAELEKAISYEDAVTKLNPNYAKTAEGSKLIKEAGDLRDQMEDLLRGGSNNKSKTTSTPVSTGGLPTRPQAHMALRQNLGLNN